jgi:hypothetical protein
VAWVKSPIDRFILARLEEKGLKPAPPADKRTLLRRAYFDLIGLPPTPEEVEAFLSDSSPGAFEKVVDRLLASPHYGERWGRHWLDVARYADSNGMDENLAMGNAWRYRDYVVRAFNDDRPYDCFLREQIAGDLLPGAGADGLIATGFLSIGPKMLAEDDPVKMEMDVIDEQVDTVGRTFLGLTLGCARCHDHKFDPIPTADYYALAGVFKSTKTMENFKVVARWHERPVGTAEELERLRRHDVTAGAKKGEIDALVGRANEDLLREARKKVPQYLAAAAEWRRGEETVKGLKSVLATADGAKVPGLVLIEAEDFARGNVKKEHTGYGEKIGVIYNAGPLPNVAEYDVTLTEPGAWQVELRCAAAESRPVRLSVNGRLVKADAAGRVTGSWYPDTQAWGVEGVVALAAGKNTLRLERDGPFPHLDKLALVPWRGEAPRTAEQIAAEQGLVPEFVLAWARHLGEPGGKPPEGEALARLVDDPNGPFALPSRPEAHYPEATAGEARRLRDELAALEKARPALPEAMGVSEGTPTNLRVHLRGSHLTLGKEVPRQFPRVLAGERHAPVAEGSGRRQLAEWLTRPDHPLTARVMVNRVWRWHFGEGLVRTTDNFGRLGDRPAHPELLDWLAVCLVADGWSVKALHRLVMLSSTYQMSTAYDERAALLDPENRLHWRRDRRRLEAEALRDAILAVSGRLDRAMGGTLYPGENRKYVIGYPNTTYDKYDFERRSVYLPVIRSDVYSVLQAFDFPDPAVPSGERPTTTVAPQALFLMNGKLVREQTRHMAAGLLGETRLDDAGRVWLAYERAYGRAPDERETARALAFLRRCEEALAGEKMDAGERRLRAWQSLCRVVLAANEFVYVE